MTKRGSRRVDLMNGANPEKVTSSKYIFENDKFKKLSESNVLDDENIQFTQEEFEEIEQEYIKMVKNLNYRVESLEEENEKLKKKIYSDQSKFENETYKEKILELKEQLDI